MQSANCNDITPYTTRNGDSWVSIARAFYGPPYGVPFYGRFLYLVNQRAVRSFTQTIPPGTLLFIPKQAPRGSAIALAPIICNGRTLFLPMPQTRFASFFSDTKITIPFPKGSTYDLAETDEDVPIESPFFADIINKRPSRVVRFMMNEVRPGGWETFSKGLWDSSAPDIYVPGPGLWEMRYNDFLGIRESAGLNGMELVPLLLVNYRQGSNIVSEETDDGSAGWIALGIGATLLGLFAFWSKGKKG